MIKKISIGIISGLITGLFATGGGTILIPGFVYFMEIPEKEARATAICCVLPATIVSFIFYYKDKYVDIKLGTLAAIGGIIGACIGQKLLNKLSDRILKICFIAFLVYVSIKFVFIE